VTSRSRGPWLGILAGLVLATGCAPESSPLLREDFDRLRTDLLRSQQALQKGQADLRAEIHQGDLRNAQTLTDVQKSVARLEGRVDNLARDAGQIQGRLDELRKRVDLLAQGSGYPAPGTSAALGGELTGGSGSPGGAAALPSTGTGPTWPVPAPPSTAAPGGPVAQRAPISAGPGADLYQIAYIDYTRGNYNLAIAGFREFLRLSPTSDLNEKAQYWIAESHFSQARLLQTRGEKERAVKEFEQAVQAFRQVYVDHPRGDRVPAAAYKEALTLLEVNQPALAVARLQWLVDSFPSTEEAAKAREDLARIKKR
jgi:TolA-binding protein